MSDPLAGHDPEEVKVMMGAVFADLDARVPLEVVERSLVEAGWTEEEAKAAVARADGVRLAEIREKYAVKRALLTEKRRKGVWWRMGLGVFLLSLGLLLGMLAFLGPYISLGLLKIGALGILVGGLRFYTAWSDWRE